MPTYFSNLHKKSTFATYSYRKRKKNAKKKPINKNKRQREKIHIISTSIHKQNLATQRQTKRKKKTIITSARKRLQLNRLTKCYISPHSYNLNVDYVLFSNHIPSFKSSVFSYNYFFFQKNYYLFDLFWLLT